LIAAGVAEKHLADAEVILAELLGNVVRHTPGPCTVFLDTDGDVPVLSVLDRGPDFVHPAPLPADALAERGRGLFIVRALAFEFSAAPRPGGGTHARAVLAAQCKPRASRTTPPTLAVAI
jgi:anti-sigma regulatory factor (Ser/Thr protein kinase)